MLDHALSRLATAARFGHATAPGAALGDRPEQALMLYQYEGCPMCRRVREAITDLALPVEMRPCPKGGDRFRPEAMEASGKAQFPFLVDPNTGVSMLESEEIVHYLYANYGTGTPPSWLFGLRFVASSVFVSAVRDAVVQPRGEGALAPTQLCLQGAEADPGARRVRERLCALEIPYRWEPGPLRLIDEHNGAVLDSADAILDSLQH